MKKLLFILIVLASTATHAQTQIETITFPSGDGLIEVTADTYIDNSNTKFILLCHQAGYSRGEYIETALVFVEKGFNSMAIDQRSGNQVNGVVNETHEAAMEAGLPTDYTDAIPDIEAAIDKAYELNGNNSIYLLGSSYSSSLALIMGKNNTKVKASIAFSPGEYLSGIDVSDEITDYEKSVFVTSSQSEIPGVLDLVSGIDLEFLTHYQPTVAGIHGSRCLWSSTTGYELYWEALEQFLLSTLNTTNQSTKQDYAIYPNPTNGILFFNTEAIQNIEIYNTLGETVKTVKNSNTVDLSKEVKGEYFVKVHTAKGISIYKVILQQ